MQSVSITTNLVSLNPTQVRCVRYNICLKVCQWLATGQWFSRGTPVSSTNKTDHHDITEILLKVALNTIIQSNPIQNYFLLKYIFISFPFFFSDWMNLLVISFEHQTVVLSTSDELWTWMTSKHWRGAIYLLERMEPGSNNERYNINIATLTTKCYSKSKDDEIQCN